MRGRNHHQPSEPYCFHPSFRTYGLLVTTVFPFLGSPLNFIREHSILLLETSTRWKQGVSAISLYNHIHLTLLINHVYQNSNNRDCDISGPVDHDPPFTTLLSKKFYHNKTKHRAFRPPCEEKKCTVPF